MLVESVKGVGSNEEMVSEAFKETKDLQDSKGCMNKGTGSFPSSLFDRPLVESHVLEWLGRLGWFFVVPEWFDGIGRGSKRVLK